jgi:hypothetical protein
MGKNESASHKHLNEKRRLDLVVYALTPYSVPMLTAVVLLLDSRVMQDVLPYGQVWATLLTAAYFLCVMRTLSAERRLIIGCFVLVAIVGECLFSLVFKLYEYRLSNIPVYVPLGHPLLLVMAWALAEKPWLQRHSATLTPWLAYCHIVALGVVLLVWGDTLSLAFAALGVYLFRRRRFTLIYGLMGFIVLGLELLGTSLGCWEWAASSAGGWLHSTNPPYGAFLGYVAADLASIKLARRISARWFPRLQIAAP